MPKEVHQIINAPVHGPVVGGNLTINNHHAHHRHTHHHGPLHIDTLVVQQSESFALQAPPAPPARKPRPRRPAYDITPAQKELLALMRPLPKPVRIEVLNWLRCEFGTSMVMELEPRELYQTRQHVLDVRRAAGI
ncbi:MAG: hypothetical protein ABI606_01720 [Rhodoferax sp.]